MKEDLIKFLPFWKSEDIGIISKICLTFTTVIMGLLSGVTCLLQGIRVLSSSSGLTQGDVLSGLLYLISGGAYICYYIYVRKGFYLNDLKYIIKACLMFVIAFFSYRCVMLGMNMRNLINATLITIVLLNPLIKIILKDKLREVS